MVSRLSDLIDAATTDATSVAALLRMTKVIAARMDTPPLIDWVDNELAGYRPGAPIPEYRGPFTTQVISDWSGPFNSLPRNVPIPPSAVPKWLRDIGGFEVEFHQSVSELQRLAQGDGPLAFAWPTDSIARLNGEMRSGGLSALQQMVPDHGIVSAHRVIATGIIAGVLDNVRTRVLNLALDLVKVAPDAGEPGSAPADPATASTVTNIVNNHIYGHGNAVAINSPGTIQLPEVQIGDLDSLIVAMQQLGVAPTDITELKDAIQGDEADAETPKGKPGGRVKKFMGKVALGGLAAAGKDGIKEGAAMLGELVRHFYGIG